VDTASYTILASRYYEGAFAHGHHSSCKHYDWDMLLFWFFFETVAKDVFCYVDFEGYWKVN